MTEGGCWLSEDGQGGLCGQGAQLGPGSEAEPGACSGRAWLVLNCRDGASEDQVTPGLRGQGLTSSAPFSLILRLRIGGCLFLSVLWASLRA